MKELKKWEKIFIIISCSVIAISFFVYLFRFVYYYNLEHKKYKVDTLIQKVTNSTVSTGDGLYILDENNYFYKGIDVSNYIWYSGNMYRIVSISGSNIKLISDDSISVIAWGSESKFSDSYVNEWLNASEENKSIYLDSINNYQVYLKEFNYCNASINKKCLNKDEYYASLLTRSEYLNAGGKLSYLNNETNYWIIDDTNESEKAYVFKEGGLGVEENTTSLSSYGVRPVITINGNITNTIGSGTKEDPYIVKEQTGNKLSEKKIGEYVTYNDYTFRIMAINENGVKLLLDKKIEDVNLNYYEVSNYINNTFASKFGSLGTCVYYTASYGALSNYDYKNVYIEPYKGKVGLQNIGDIFMGDDDNYWLYSSYDQSGELAYKTNTNSTVIADTKGTANKVRPILCASKDIEITSGNGTKASPYVVED